MRDRFQVYSNAALVTPSDTVPLSPAAWSLYLTVAATALKITTAGGQTITLGAVPTGILPILVTQVWATPAPPAGILALW